MQRPNLAPLSCVNVECGRNEMDPCAVKTVPWNEGSIVFHCFLWSFLQRRHRHGNGRSAWDAHFVFFAC
jgi:hypothetical protein